MTANKLKLNPDKVEIMLVGQEDVLRKTALPTFNRIQLTLTDSVENLGVLLYPALLLEMLMQLQKYLQL